jgi:hypothetical protein
MKIIKQSPNRFAFAALATVVGLISATRPAWGQTSVVIDPAGDVDHHAPAFQDIVRGEIQKKGGSFTLRMEMVGPIPGNPPLPQPANGQIWWVWALDLDRTTVPKGYPFAPGDSAPSDFYVYVSWDGVEFKGYAIDRRPLLTGGNAIVTPVPFSIDGPTIEAVLASALIGNVPSFRWGVRTIDIASSHLGTSAIITVDSAPNFTGPAPGYIPFP